MSSAAWLPAAAGGLVAAAAVTGLLRGAERHRGPLRRAYRWFAVTAACWAAGLAIGQAAPAGPAGALTLTDLPSLLGLVALAAGLRALAADAVAAGPDPRPGRRRAGALAARLADGYLLAAAIFLIGWVTIFAADYARWDESVGTFTAEMIHPLADVAVLGGVLSMTAAAGRRAITPCLALLVVAAGDALAVTARVTAHPPSVASQLLVVAALGLLALTAPAAWQARLAGPRWLPRRLPAVRAGAEEGGGHPPRVLPAVRTAADGGGGRPPLVLAGRPAAATITAAGAAAAAALVIMGWGLAGSPGAGPVVVLAGGSAAVALAVRVLGLAWQQRRAPQPWLEAGRQFRELADRTSDVVLVCGLDGTVRYASPAVADYGYSPDELAGAQLTGLLHPEDRAGGTRAAREAAGVAGPPAGRYPCRVRAADGTWRHVQATVSRYRNPAGADELLITARDVSDQVALRRQVAHLTFHDGLTGLPNRAYIEDRARAVLDMAQAPAPGAPAAAAPVAGIILLDLDGFTAVNDSAGHSAGDLILAQAARRLRAAVPPADTVARWGGDEFAVLIAGSAAGREIIDIADRLAACISASAFRVGDRELWLTASVGVALADGSPPGYLWRNADMAMSRAKDAGGGRVEAHAPAGDAAPAPRLVLAGELQQALAAGTLTISYQPVVELSTGQVASAAAAVRMRRSAAEVPPAELLAAAEASGLIVPLGEWVLREACAQAGQWRRAGLAAGVWVKVSPAQAVAPRFAESVLAALTASGLPPGALTLEATERDLVPGGTVLPGLAEVRAHGVRLAIGDFGTDYASLSYLRRRPVDVVRIDSEFVAGLGADPELAKLVEAIVRVGRDLGIDVVAAGIGHPQQLALLRAMGCQFGQGALVAPDTDATGLTAVAAPGLVGPAPGAAAAPAPGPVAVAPGPATAPAPAATATGAGGPPEDETCVPDNETKLLSS